MSISNPVLSRSLAGCYTKSPLSLKEQTLAKLAIQVCQCLKLESHNLSTRKPVNELKSFIVWYDCLEEKSSAVCETISLPHSLKEQLIFRIRETAVCFFGLDKKLAQNVLIKMSPEVVDEFTKLLVNLKVECVNRILEHCLVANATRKTFKEKFLKRCAKDICCSILKSSRYGEVTQFLSWAFVTEESINFFRQIYFSGNGCIKMLADLIKRKRWQNSDFFLKWCGFNLEGSAISLIKEDVMYNTQDTLLRLLRVGDTETISLYLKWGLTNVVCAMTFKDVLDNYISEKRFPSLPTCISERKRIKWGIGPRPCDEKQMLLTWHQLMEDHISYLNKRPNSR